MVRKKSKKKVLPLLVIISAIIFTGLIGAIIVTNINPIADVETTDTTIDLSFSSDEIYYKYFIPNSTINTSSVLSKNIPYSFNWSDDNYMITTTVNCGADGFNWNGSTWLPNSTINASIIDTGNYCYYSEVEWNGTKYLASGEEFGRLLFYNWSGTEWLQEFVFNSTFTYDVGFRSTPEFLYIGTDLYAIVGEGNTGGNFNGYNFNGTHWNTNATIISGLPDIGSESRPRHEEIDGIHYLFSGSGENNIFSWYWSGTSWMPEFTLNKSIMDIIGNTSGHIIPVKLGTDNYMLTVNGTAKFFNGYVLDSSTTLKENKFYWNRYYKDVSGSNFVFISHFNNDSTGETDTVIKDLSIYKNNATVTGYPDNVYLNSTSEHTLSYNFTGNTAYINVGSISQLDYTKDFSVCARFQSPNLTGYLLDVVSDDRDSSNKIWHLMVNSTGIWFKAQGTGSTYRIGTITPANNTWEHICILYDADNNQATYYRNGTLVETDTIISPIQIGTNKNIYIGSSRGTGNFFQGLIDDVIIANYTLTSADIYNAYNYQNLSAYTSLGFSDFTLGADSNYYYNVTKNINAITITPNYNESYKYKLCISNLTDYETCSIENIITRYFVIPTVSISANFSTEIGIINSRFYGVNSELTQFNIANEDFVKSEFLDVGIKNVRYTAYLDRYYSNTSDSSGVNFTDYGSIPLSSSIEGMKLLYEHNKTVTLVIAYLPSYLGDNSSGYCSSLTRCYPTNYTKFNNIVLDYINRVTNNGEYISAIEGFEFWNEPDLHGFFLGLVADDNQTRSDIYNEFYNQTRIAVKGEYPTIPFYGPAVSTLYFSCGKSLMHDFLTVNGNNTDGISHHQYFEAKDPGNDFGSLLTSYMGWLDTNCTALNVDCTPNRITEGNVKISSMMLGDTTTNILNNTKQIALAYNYLLNTEPQNYSFDWFMWSGSWPITRYYPYKFYMTLDNGTTIVSEHTSLYNVTKNYIALCPAGSNVYVSNSTNSDIKITQCKKGNQYGLILINNGEEQYNLSSLNLSLTNGSVFYPYTSIMNYETGASIPVSTSGIVQLGVLDSHEVLYLTSGDEDGGTLVNLFKLNEATGTRVYDLLQNVTYGTISGASWINDSILITLSAVQYTIDLVTGLLTLDTDYLYEYLFVDYDYNKVFGFHVSILGVIAGFLMIIVLGVGIIYVVKYFRNIKELE